MEWKRGVQVQKYRGLVRMLVVDLLRGLLGLYELQRRGQRFDRGRMLGLMELEYELLQCRRNLVCRGLLRGGFDEGGRE